MKPSENTSDGLAAHPEDKRICIREIISTTEHTVNCLHTKCFNENCLQSVDYSELLCFKKKKINTLSGTNEFSSIYEMETEISEMDISHPV